MPVYFIRAGDTEMVKIGWSQDVPQRVAAIQTGCPVEVRVIRILDADRRAEARLHRQFAECRQRGEWFSFSSDMLGDVGLADLPLPVSRSSGAGPLPSEPFFVPTAAEIESAAKAAGLSVAAMCREIGIDPSTFFRWRGGQRNIGIETVRHMQEAIERRLGAASVPLCPACDSAPECRRQSRCARGEPLPAPQAGRDAA